MAHSTSFFPGPARKAARIQRAVQAALRAWPGVQAPVAAAAGTLAPTGNGGSRDRPDTADSTGPGNGGDRALGSPWVHGLEPADPRSPAKLRTPPVDLPVALGVGGDNCQPGVIASLPRRAEIRIGSEQFAPPPMRQTEVFETTIFSAIGRLFVWLTALMSFWGGTFWDRLRGRDTIERRAVRLRETLERTGATFIKFGQQLSVRADVLPYAYCRELIKMLDRVPPFPTAQAIETIERATGKPIGETFAVFDPEPIGSASLACVYQAQLFTGERVAVKVRRPRIGEKFAADLRALDWLLILSEWLTLVRPGFTTHLRHDLRQTLFEELDFRKEARYQDLFRRRAKKKSARHFFSAPRVYFELSNEEVIVQEFASGLWLWELLEIVDRQDEVGLAYIRQLNINPKVVAKRLHWVAMWGMINDLFFHADPHPANVIIRPDNHLVFIDFGSCGAYDQSRRAAMQQLFYHQQRDDIAGMVQASLHLLEPLPPIDVTEFAKELQLVYRQQQYAMRSKQTVWFEHSTSGIFIEMIGLSRKYGIPMNSDVLRIGRANMLYDTLAARLHSRVDPERVYRRFVKDVGKQARRRVLKSMRTRVAGGLAPQDYLAVETAVDTVYRLAYRVQRFLDSPGLKLPYMVEKWVYVVSTAIKLCLLVAVFAGAAVALVAAQQWSRGQGLNVYATWHQVVANGWFQLFALVVVFLNVRKVLFRLNDKGATES